MATTQLDCSIGFKKEATYGTPVTVDRFLEFTEESLDYDRTYYQGTGLRVGSRMARSRRRILAKEGVSGDISLEVPTRGTGTLLELLLGTAGSTIVDTGSDVYQQIFTPIQGDYLPTATIQKGVPRLGQNTVDAYTAAGAACSNFEFSASAGDVLKLKTSWVARSFATDIDYATPSYPSDADLFSWVGASLTVGGTVTLPTDTELATGGTTVADVRDFSASYDQGLDDNGYNMGGAGMRSRPPAVGLGEGKGKLTAEYDTTDFRDAVANQTDIALVATFEGAVEIETGKKPTLQIVVPCIRFDGALPKSAGGNVITQELDFTMLDNQTADHPLYVVVRTADTEL